MSGACALSSCSPLGTWGAHTLALQDVGPFLTEHVSLSFPTKEEHPSVAPGELFADYLPRTEQHWLRCARDDVGPGAPERRVLRAAQALAQAFYDSSAGRWTEGGTVPCGLK